MFFRRIILTGGTLIIVAAANTSFAGQITPIASPFTSTYQETFEGFANNELNHHVFGQNESIFGGSATMSWNSTVDPFRDPSGPDGGLYPSPPISTVRTFLDYAAGAADPGDVWGTGRAPTGTDGASYWVPNLYDRTKPNLNKYSLGVGNYNYDPSAVNSPPLTITFGANKNITHFGGFFGAAGDLFNLRVRIYNVAGEVIDGVQNTAKTYYTGGELLTQFAYQDNGKDWPFRWIGYESKEVIGKIEIDGNAWVMDNLQAGPTAAVPEPATMVALGLGVVGLVRKRRASK